MQAYIRTAAAFRTAYDRKVLDYEITLASLEALPSTVVLLGGDIPREQAGGWLWVANSLFLIGEVLFGDRIVDYLSVVHDMHVFDSMACQLRKCR